MKKKQSPGGAYKKSVLKKYCKIQGKTPKTMIPVNFAKFY